MCFVMLTVGNSVNLGWNVNNEKKNDWVIGVWIWSVLQHQIRYLLKV